MMSISEFLKVIFNIVPVFVLCGCVTGPYKEDYNEYLKKPQFSGNFDGIVTVDDKTGYREGHLNYTDDPAKYINDELKRGNSNFTGNPQREFSFTYFQCEEKGPYPTQFVPLNAVISFFTLTLLPVGYEKECRVDLDAKTVDKKQDQHFSRVFKFRSSSSLVPTTKKKASWQLPARRLLKDYEEANP